MIKIVTVFKYFQLPISRNGLVTSSNIKHIKRVSDGLVPNPVVSLRHFFPTLMSREVIHKEIPRNCR
jgi:hypothetical protein